ncbi:MAG: LacI family DNA-binding transcriptional regulator [Opitutaceae bacterium]|nr:LacI family DNA-binding transcriptional regulator [Opitutaceae bacterium]
MPANPNPSLKAVARVAKVSISTASRALHGHSRLLPATIQAVQAAARRVGYQTNPFISGTMRRVRNRGQLGHLGAIAYLTFHDTPQGWRRNSTYLRFHEGASRRAQDLGFQLDTIWAREPRMHAKRLSAILDARGIVGVVVGPRPAQPRPDLLDWERFSTACVGVPLPEVKLHQAGSHHARLLARALTVLEERRYRRVGLVLLDSQVSKTEPGWVATWCHRQEQTESRFRVPLLVMPALDSERIARWLRRFRPDAIIGLHDELADIVRECGLRVPEEVGFAHLSRADRPDAPAGMDQRPRVIGAAAVDLVTNQIFSGERGVAKMPHALLIEGEWIDGWSVRPA